MSSVLRSFGTLPAHARPMIGDTKISNVNTDHLGWLLCDGRSLTVSGYTFLFNVIGYQFGGSGGNFNLPDPAGRVPGIAGAGSGLTVRNIGDSVGEETHVLDISEMPQHVHTGQTDPSGLHIHDITDPGHQHGYFNQPNEHEVAVSLTTTGTADNVNVNQLTTNNTTGITINPNGIHAHTFTTNPTGGSQPHNNIQPTLFIGNMFIYSGLHTNGVWPNSAGYSWF